MGRTRQVSRLRVRWSWGPWEPCSLLESGGGQDFLKAQTSPGSLEGGQAPATGLASYGGIPE